MKETISPYYIKQETFEGPLDLLLSLIEQKKLFINEISLKEVTDEYISYIKNIKDDNKSSHISDMSYFILIASTLILIKSKSLLPDLMLTEDETEKIVDLETRLSIYKIIKNASLEINNNFGKKIIFMPNDRIWSEHIFFPDDSINITYISESIISVLNNAPKKIEKTPEIEIKKVININEVIQNLTERIQNAINLSFKDFSKSFNAENEQEEKVHIIVSFLAMLELVREGIIDVIQNSSVEDIQISKQIIN